MYVYGYKFIILRGSGAAPYKPRTDYTRRTIMYYYAGIGSRETPPIIMEEMRWIARVMAQLGHTLRSGGADGADSAFEKGCDEMGGKKDIYLPWPGYNGRNDAHTIVTAKAIQMAGKVHPAWHRCSNGARKLHGRNVHILLGLDMITPVKFVVCWTKDGKATGGTGLGIRLANQLGIHVYNLNVLQDREIILSWIRKKEQELGG